MTISELPKGPFVAALLSLLALPMGCSKKAEPTPTRVAPPASGTAKAEFAGTVPFVLESVGDATFLIDAPLEKIKGKATGVRGKIELNPTQLSATRGQIDVDLATLTTSTFDDAGKNAKQTEHSHNWLELGNDVEPQQRAENQWARFVVRTVRTGGVENLTRVPAFEGKRTVEVTAEGEFWLHGVAVHKTIRLGVSFLGTAEAPTELRVKSLEPLVVSLKEHDVKPRDVAGKFLQGALEKVGQKIDDKVQLTLEFTAKPDAAAKSGAATGMKEFATTPTDQLGTLPPGIGIPVGQKAPDAMVEDADGKPVKLSDLVHKGPVFLAFYRGGWCPYCSFEIHELTTAFPEYQKRGVTPVAISVDRPEVASKSRATYKIPFPVLSDPTLVAHRAYKVIHRVDDAEFAKLKGLGIDIEKASGQNHHSFAIPALFLIDASMTVRWAHANPDYKVRPRTPQLLAAIDAAKL